MSGCACVCLCTCAKNEMFQAPRVSRYQVTLLYLKTKYGDDAKHFKKSNYTLLYKKVQ